MITLYTNHCPCCEVLERELAKAGITFDTCADIKKMLSMGFTHLPILDVNGQLFTYPEALKWIKERNEHP